jgi:hypothetical protein
MEERNIRDGDETPEAEILDKCFRELTNFYGHPEWSMIAHGVERQWDGYRKLYPSE